MITMLSLKIAFVIALAAAVTTLLRRAPAAVRHATWLMTIAGILALPFFVAKVPVWRVPILTSHSEKLQTMKIDGPSVTVAGTTVGAIQRGVLSQASTSAPRVAGANPAHESTHQLNKAALLYAVGVACVLAWILLGRFALARIAARAQPLDTEWNALLERERAVAGVTRRVRLLTANAVRTPVTFGTTRPVILLPVEAETWSAEKRVVVLRHEMSHIQRRDASAQLLAGIACAFYWYHPAVWMAAWRLRIEREHACDDRVLLLGTDAGDYASHLLDLARSARWSARPAFGAMGMAKSQLEQRVMAILDDGKSRIEERSNIRVPALVLATLVLMVVSAFTPVPQTPQTPQTKRPPQTPPQLIRPSRDTITKAAPRKIVKVSPPKLIRGLQPRQNFAPIKMTPLDVQSLAPVDMTPIKLAFVVTADDKGSQHWFEITGTGASLEVASAGNVRKKDGRILVHTPARITMQAEGAFNYTISSLEETVPQLDFMIEGTRSFARGGTFGIQRKKDGTVRASAAMVWGGMDPSMRMYETAYLPPDCAAAGASLGIRTADAECWLYWRVRFAPDGTAVRDTARASHVGTFSSYRVRQLVPDSLLPPPRLIVAPRAEILIDTTTDAKVSAAGKWLQSDLFARGKFQTFADLRRIRAKVDAGAQLPRAKLDTIKPNAHKEPLDGYRMLSGPGFFEKKIEGKSDSIGPAYAFGFEPGKSTSPLRVRFAPGY